MDVVQDLLDDVRLSDGRSGSRLCENSKTTSSDRIQAARFFSLVQRLAWVLLCDYQSINAISLGV